MKTADFVAATAVLFDRVTKLFPNALDALGAEPKMTPEQEQVLLLLQVAVRDLYRWLHVDELPDDDADEDKC